MKANNVILIIEASSTGFGIYIVGFPVTAYGNTIEDAKQNLKRSLIFHFHVDKVVLRESDALNFG